MNESKWTCFWKKYGRKLIALLLVITLTVSLVNLGLWTDLFFPDEDASENADGGNSTKPTSPEATTPKETVSKDQTLKLEEALEQLNKSIEKDPSDPKLYTQRAAVQYNLNKPDAAIADYTSALALKEDPQTRYLRAVVYAATGDNEKAYADLTVALEATPDSKDYMSLMADTCNALKKYDQALEYLEKLLVKDPNNCVLLTLAGDACVYLGNFEAALPHYEKAVINFTDKTEKEGISKATLYSAYGNCLKTLSRFPEAAKAYDESLKLADNKELYFQRGFCLLQSEKYTEAVKDFTESIKRGHETTYSHFQRGLCYYALEKYKEATEDFKVYEKAFPKKNDTWLYMGLCYQNLKDYAAAIPYYTKCVDAKISAGTCHYNLGNCYYSLEKYTEAEASYTSALNANAHIYESLLNRGLTYIKLNKYNEAKVDLKRVIDECKDSSLVESAKTSYEPIKNITIITNGGTSK